VLGAPSTPPPAPNPSISTIKTKEEETPGRETRERSKIYRENEN